MSLARAGGKRHKIRRERFDEYVISWEYEVKYRGSRLLHCRSIVRDTNRKGAMRFAKKFHRES